MATRSVVQIYEGFLIVVGMICLSMSEENISLMKTTNQSTTHQTHPANRSVDGCLDQKFNNDCCSHTSPDESTAWWRVDLGQPSTIDNITIYYRDGKASRFAGYRLYVSNTTSDDNVTNNGVLCYEDQSSTEAEVRLVVTHYCPYVAKYVTVYNFRNNPLRYNWYNENEAFLELCEVQVFGCPVGTFGNGDCNEDCSGCNGGICNSTSGICRYGCNPGRHGSSCDKCTATCKQNKCNAETGYCQECETGYYADFCDRKCSTGCTDSMCDRINGHCTGCKPGVHGENCAKACPTNCKTNTCNEDTGHCSECEAGYYADHCDRECSPGCKDNICDQSNGQCGESFNIAAVVTGCTLGVFVLVLVILYVALVKRLSRIQSATKPATK
ncbi:EGF-like domain-containing protein comC [Mizuhopecten yessoensis]|uniref:EGF-like domain-containing protein comC n=1 Tax=Mizuhopecten yessoensis TaxID=6573 RepID=UPI000B458758|nr:EGF-like domain-containing protein comC [Mizuhopecten yessoensis]